MASPSSAARAVPSPRETLSPILKPVTALSTEHARFPEFSLDKGPPAPSGSLGDTGARSSNPRHRQRERSWSIGSLHALERGPRDSRHSSFAAAETRPARRGSTGVTTEGETTSGASLADLSWGKWWPFQVVEPPLSPTRADKGKGRQVDPDADEEQHTSTRNFLELFAGKAPTAGLHETALDRAEDELLNASLEELNRAEEFPTRELSSPTRPSLHSRTASPSRHYLPTTTFSSISSKSFLAGLSISPEKTIHHGRQYSAGTRKQVDGFLDPEDKKRAAEEEARGMDMFDLIKERYNCPKYPIVFLHGLFGFSTIGPASIKPLHFSYWVGVKEALEAIGVEVLIAEVPSAASIEERARVLCQLIEDTFPGREVNLVGHSMGGLDGRFLISRLKPTTFHIKSLTTIATPHRGSSYADWILKDVIGEKRIPALLKMCESIGVPGGGAAFEDLTVTKMERFNMETPNSPDVLYLSYGAQFNPSWSNVYRHSWGIIMDREGENDGLVSVESSKWGEYQATLQNVNHLDLVGWVGKIRFGWAELLGKRIKFRPVSFYCGIAELLADRGL